MYCCGPMRPCAALEGKAPKFPLEERLYLLQSHPLCRARLRLVTGHVEPDAIPQVDDRPDAAGYIWVVDEASDTRAEESLLRIARAGVSRCARSRPERFSVVAGAPIQKNGRRARRSS